MQLLLCALTLLHGSSLAAEQSARPSVILIISDDQGFPDDGFMGAKRVRTPRSDKLAGVRTPMFVRWPGKVQPLRDDETLASIIDFAPTIHADQKPEEVTQLSQALDAWWKPQ